MAQPVTTDALDSPAVGLLLTIAARNVRVELTMDGRLIAEPASKLTADEQAAFRKYAPEIAVLLRCRDVDVSSRRVAFELQVAQTPAPRVPAFLFRPNVSYTRHLLQLRRCAAGAAILTQLAVFARMAVGVPRADFILRRCGDRLSATSCLMWAGANESTGLFESDCVGPIELC